MSCHLDSAGWNAALTILLGSPTVSKTYWSRKTTKDVNSAWNTTDRMIAPWMAPLTNRKTSGHLRACQHLISFWGRKQLATYRRGLRRAVSRCGYVPARWRCGAKSLDVCRLTAGVVVSLKVNLILQSSVSIIWPCDLMTRCRNMERAGKVSGVAVRTRFGR